MKKIFLAVFVSLLAGTAAHSQSTTESKPTQPKTITISESKKAPAAAAAPTRKRGPVFRPTKEQVKQAQTILKERSLYSGDTTGRYNDETRSAIRTFQKANGLTSTGSLNRETLEKLNIELTDKQKAIPVPENSDVDNDKAKSDGDDAAASADTKPKRSPIFRASKEQVMAAQKILIDASMYSGEQTGKLDDATRDGLKKYQEANGLKVTGTLNQVTLEKMGIELTDTQKSM
ncbi:MAG: peptidoglycan-binding protein [Pyrinomonadaceae bacterium]